MYSYLNIDMNYEILELNYERICRVCLSIKEEVTNVFLNLNNSHKSIASAIMECASIKITKSVEIMPTNICQQCLNRLNDIDKFRILCISSNAKLNALIEEGKNKLQNEKNKQSNLVFETTVTKHKDFNLQNYSFNGDPLSIKVEEDSLNISENETNFNLYDYSSNDPLSIIKDENKTLIASENGADLSNEQININEKLTNESEESNSIDSLSEESNDWVHNKEERGKYKCEHCHEKFSYLIKLFTHKCKKGLSCPMCFNIYASKTELEKHKNSHIDQKGCNCKICGKTFKDSIYLSMHIRSIHLKKPETKQFLCPICGKTMLRHDSYQMHLKVHSGQKTYKCESCGKSFVKGSSLRIHMKTHSNQHDYACLICGNTFKYKSSMNRHIQRHNKKISIPCHICGKLFCSITTLNIHLNIHTGEKCFTCKECGKVFNRLDNLRTHNKIHTGERSFECSVCNKKFMHKHVLSGHMKTHTTAKE